MEEGTDLELLLEVKSMGSPIGIDMRTEEQEEIKDGCLFEQLGGGGHLLR